MAFAGPASLLNELANRILKGEQLTADGVTGLLAPGIVAHEVGREPSEWCHPEEHNAAQHALADHEAFTTPPEPLPAPLSPVQSPIDLTPPRTDPSGQLSLWQLLVEPIVRKPTAKVRQQPPAGQLSFLELITA